MLVPSKSRPPSVTDHLARVLEAISKQLEEEGVNAVTVPISSTSTNPAAVNVF